MYEHRPRFGEFWAAGLAAASRDQRTDIDGDLSLPRQNGAPKSRSVHRRSRRLRSGSELYENATGITHDYTHKRGVEHSEILAPADAPTWVFERHTLWNTVEASEKRKDAQLAREIEVGLPIELKDREQVALLRYPTTPQLAPRLGRSHQRTPDRSRLRRPHRSPLLPRAKARPDPRREDRHWQRAPKHFRPSGLPRRPRRRATTHHGRQRQGDHRRPHHCPQSPKPQQRHLLAPRHRPVPQYPHARRRTIPNGSLESHHLTRPGTPGHRRPRPPAIYNARDVQPRAQSA